MASDKDIIGKADALLRRHVVAPPASGSETGGVPVLTDLVEAPTGEPAVDDDLEPGAPPPRDDRLVNDVVARVLTEVEARLAAELERRLTLHLMPQVQAAVASAIGDLHQELANSVGDAVAEALRERQVK